MKVTGEMVKKKEKEFFIITKNLGKEIDMKVIGEMIKGMEKEYIIIIMVIDPWVIIIMVIQKENMHYLLNMEK